MVWQQTIVKDVWQRASLLGKGALGRVGSPLPVSCLLRADPHVSFGSGAEGRESREVHSVGFEAEMRDAGFPFSSSISVAAGENPHCGSLGLAEES